MAPATTAIAAAARSFGSLSCFIPIAAPQKKKRAAKQEVVVLARREM
jgi:hypothetical protein